MAFNRKSKSSSEPVEVLDTSEQDKIIGEYEAQLNASDVATRRGFVFIFRVIAAIFLCIFILSTYQVSEGL